MQNTSTPDTIGVLGGSSGIALFHFYYAAFSEDTLHSDQGAAVISETFNRIQEGYSYPTFCDGIAGACWVLELLKEEQFVTLQEDVITAELDNYLLDCMKKDIAENNYDFLHGAIGYGYYFLKRYQQAETVHSKKQYQKHLMPLITFLTDTAISGNTGIWWKSVIKVGEEKFEGCNLGLSHGMSSILNFLSRVSIYPDFSDQALPLVKPAIKHILDCKHTDMEYTSTFPNWITSEKPEGYNSRLAWCYGDLGVGISLLRAGELLEDEDLMHEAITVLKLSAKRKDIKEALVKDAGVCHGAFGIIHIYRFLYKKTHDTVFKKTADYWANVGLEMATHTDGYAGYLFGYEGSWKLQDCLLDGIAGVGLAILSYLTDDETMWDEALMIG
ncbi:lanthionine synthetase C family protein [Aquimarina sp. RZ0]|uniref:lanthionine synthetase C family protein n=1 Tax=Aquimarina sp. RZ0 TaxID=2607730 RepID=UPI0011F1B069|nr:lanthionine synthetase C family protein [Aquimarina sp. RZ0]KAA1247639.1 lanthionine synthetase C family protein [Aquimarina sp. RZ0]